MPAKPSSDLSLRRAELEFDEFLVACEYDRNCAAGTIDFYRKKGKRFLTWAREQKIATIDAQTIRQFFRWLKDQGLSENGRHVYLRALRTWLNFLLRRKVLASSPLADADLRIRVVWKRPELPRADELDRLLRQMRTDVFPRGRASPHFLRLRDFALFMWYAETGARRREGLVSVDDLDMEYARAMTIQKVREREETRPLFFHALRPLLKFYLEERETFLKALGKEDVRALWITGTGEAMVPDTVSQVFERIKGRYGWPGPLHPHKLRAVAATMGALAKDRTALEVRMGWAPNSPVAKRYISLAQELEATTELTAALSPLRTMARLRRPRQVPKGMPSKSGPHRFQ